MKRKRDEIYGLKPPKSLLVYSSSVTVPATLSYISITASGSGDTPGWNLSDHWKPFSLAIGLSTETNIQNGEDWEFIEWDSWIRQNSAVDGNQRLARCFTIDYQSRVYLSEFPTGSDTWKAWLHYYKTPTTIADGGTPEIGIDHESLLVSAVVLDFPQLFRGEERASIYASYKMDHDRKMKNWLRDTTVKKVGSRLRPARKKTTTSSVVWGTGETS